MFGKKTFAVLIIAAMVLAMVPAAVPVHAIAVPTRLPIAGTKGTTIVVTGVAGDAPAGTVVELYLDDTTKTTFDATVGKGKLNSTTAKANGNYEVWFDVPSVPAGAHTLWVKAVATNDLNSVGFTVNPKVSLSPKSGTTGDVVTASFYGFAKEKGIVYLVANLTQSGAYPYTGTPVGPETIDNGDGAAVDFTGFLSKKPIVPGSVIITDGVEPMNDTTMVGNLVNATGVTIGTIDYANGEYDITFTVAPGVGAITATYQYYEENVTAGTYGPVGTKTNKVGYATGSFTIPDIANFTNGVYTFQAFDAKGNTAVATLTKGPTITVSTDATAAGDLIRINGRGWNPANTIALINITRPAWAGAAFPLNFPAAYGFAIQADGSWFADVYVPDCPKVKDDYTITVTDSAAVVATADFEITGMTDIVIDPVHGAGGSTITVTGTNFMNKVDVVITVRMGVTVLGTVKTKGDGSWTKSFTVPALAANSYAVTGTDAVNGYVATENYKLGDMLILLSPVKGNAGDKVTLTGYGFTANMAFNATFGTKTIVTSAQGAVSATGTINKQFNVPQLPAGTYDIKVTDVDSEVVLTVSFVIEETTAAVFDPSSAPNLYRVKVSGVGFYSSGVANTTVTFKIYNESAPGVIDKWYNIAVVGDWAGTPAAMVNSTGYIEDSYWDVDADTILSKGSYFIEVKDAQGYKVTVPFTIGDAHIVAATRKATFKPGETITFSLEHSLGNIAPQWGSYLRIYNPSGALVFDGDGLFGWIKVGTYYVDPYSDQTASGNAMILQDDAPTGTWTWKWLKAGSTTKTIATGSFTVATSGGSVDPDIAALQQSVSDLQTSITGVQTSVSTEISGLKTDIAGIKSDVSGISTSVTAQVNAIKTDVAGVKTDVAALQAAVSADVAGVKTDVAGLKTSVAGLVTSVTATNTAVTNLATSVAAINTSATGASAAAKGAQDAVNSLQTLVYVAVGASMVAAIAAIVALMQISRKIA